MDIKSFFKKIWEIVKEILPYAIIILCVLNLLSQCNASRRYIEQFNIVSGNYDDLANTIEQLRAGIDEQGSTINQLREQQSSIGESITELNNTVQSTNEHFRELIDAESGVNSTVGAARATVHRLESIITTTRNGIEQSGIQ